MLTVVASVAAADWFSAATSEVAVVAVVVFVGRFLQTTKLIASVGTVNCLGLSSRTFVGR